MPMRDEPSPITRRWHTFGGLTASAPSAIANAPSASRLERWLQACDLGLGQLHQRRAHHGALQPAEQDEALLHAVVHVEERRRVERLLHRIEPVVDLLAPWRGPWPSRPRTAPPADRRRRCRRPDSSPLAPMVSDAISQALWVVSSVTGRGQRLQGADVPLVQHRIGAPVLDRADRRHLLDRAASACRTDSRARSRPDTGTG